MAANILSVWNGDLETMREAARAHALQFGWDSSMEGLFGRVYPAAFERRRLQQPVAAAAAIAAA